MPNEKIKRPFAVATETAKKIGHKDFSESSPGREKRDEIAEKLKELHKGADNLLQKLEKDSSESERRKQLKSLFSKETAMNSYQRIHGMKKNQENGGDNSIEKLNNYLNRKDKNC